MGCSGNSPFLFYNHGSVERIKPAYAREYAGNQVIQIYIFLFFKKKNSTFVSNDF